MTRASTLTVLMAATLLWVPIAAGAFTLLTEGGFRMDIQDTAGGEMLDGAMDAYDTAYQLQVNGTAYHVGGASSTVSMAGRNIVMAERAMGSLAVHREIYVPPTGGDFARYLDVIENTGSTMATVSINVRGNTGSDVATVVYASSSGDEIADSSDEWFGTDDADGSVDPSLAHVFQGVTPAVRASAAWVATDNFRWDFNTTVAAGDRVAFLFFAIQKSNRAAASAEASRLAEPDDEALLGLDPYLEDILNFGLAQPGAPRVRFTSPLTMDEGSAQEIAVEVEDLEGDPTSWSWDTNNDGTFGELSGMNGYIIAAGTTDGPSTVRVGVRASDGSHMVTRYRTIAVQNVDPVVSSAPPGTAFVGSAYTYLIEVDDPGGSRDTPVYSLDRGPEGMTLSEFGVLSWTPFDRDVTSPEEPLMIEVSLHDGDGGEASQAWQLAVSPNRVPSSPVPLFPTGGVGLIDSHPRLVVANASDADFDPLHYSFEVDTEDSFDSPRLQVSGPLDEGAAFTAWEVPIGLPPALYHWRAVASDGAADSPPIVARFYVVPVDGGVPDAGTADGGPEPVDAGVAPRKRDGGCGAAPGRTSPTTGLGLILLLWLLRCRHRTRALR